MACTPVVLLNNLYWGIFLTALFLNMLCQHIQLSQDPSCQECLREAENVWSVNCARSLRSLRAAMPSQQVDVSQYLMKLCCLNAPCAMRRFYAVEVCDSVSTSEGWALGRELEDRTGDHHQRMAHSHISSCTWLWAIHAISSLLSPTPCGWV